MYITLYVNTLTKLVIFLLTLYTLLVKYFKTNLIYNNIINLYFVFNPNRTNKYYTIKIGTQFHNLPISDVQNIFN